MHPVELHNSMNTVLKTTMQNDWLSQAQATIRRQTDVQPRIGLILGSGLGKIAEAVIPDACVPYREIPGFPVSTAIGHKGQITLGMLAGHPVAVMEGRFHLYEGYTVDQVTRPIELLRSLGVDILVVTNASGGLHPQLRMGDIVVIDDHVNLMWAGPGRAVHPGEPQKAYSEPVAGHVPYQRPYYDRELTDWAFAAALRSGIRATRGVYIGMTGPNYETRAEYRWLRSVGDIVGMSTVPEALAASSHGMRVLGLSVVSNECNPDALEATDGAQVIAAVEQAVERMRTVLMDVLGRMR